MSSNKLLIADYKTKKSCTLLIDSLVKWERKDLLIQLNFSKRDITERKRKVPTLPEEEEE